jgi:hypothetical protein
MLTASLLTEYWLTQFPSTENVLIIDILLSKLNFYGITGKANDWIKSYLKNRYKRVEIKKNSVLMHVQTGEL